MAQKRLMRSSDNRQSSSDSSDCTIESDSYDVTSNLLSIEELQEKVHLAHAELKEYQRILNDLPAIYEEKFRQNLRSVAQDLRQLLDERKSLQVLVSNALVQARDSPQLLVSDKGSSAETRSRISPQIKLADELASFRFQALFNLFGELNGKRKALLFIVTGSAFLVATIIAGAHISGSRQIEAISKRVGSSSQSDEMLSKVSLRLQAIGGQSWVLVEDLDGNIVLDTILEPGYSKFLSAKKGFRVRSGRPDLLMSEVDMTPPKWLGKISDVDWFYFRP